MPRPKLPPEIKAANAKASRQKSYAKYKALGYWKYKPKSPEAKPKTKVKLSPAEKKIRRKAAWKKSYLASKAKKAAANAKIAQMYKMTPEQLQNAKGKPVSSKPVNYLSNKNLLPQIILSKQQGKMTDELAKMFMLLTEKYATKHNFVGYSYNEDMQGYALLSLVHTWKSFNEEKYDNPFAFYTQCIKNAFIQYIKKENANHEKVQRERVLLGAEMIGFDGDSDDSIPSDERTWDPINTE